MTDNQAGLGETATTFEAFLVDVIVEGDESGNPFMRLWAGDITLYIGNGLLTLCANQSELPAKVRDGLPAITQDFFSKLPDGVVLDELPDFADLLQQFPEEAQATINPHIRYLRVG